MAPLLLVELLEVLRVKRLSLVVLPLLIAGIMSACILSFVKSLKPLTLHEGDVAGPIKVTAAATVVYYPADDDKAYPAAHYRIAVGEFDGFVTTEGNPITETDIQNIKSIAVYDKTSKQVVISDANYNCSYGDGSADVKYSGFDCRLKTTAVGADKKIYLEFGMKTGPKWVSDDIDLTKTAYSSDFGDDFAGIGKTSKLYVCPDGKQVYHSSDCGCPANAPCACPAGSSFDAKTKMCITAAQDSLCPVGAKKCVDKTNTLTCVAPLVLDTAGKCSPLTDISKEKDKTKTSKEVCTAPNDIRQIDNSCGKTCGANQAQKNYFGENRCTCATGYIHSNAACVADPALNTSLSGSDVGGGGSCSLNPAVTGNTGILKLLIALMFGGASGVCLYIHKKR